MVVQMKRTGQRLLRTVNNQQHATDADHEDALPTPPASNELKNGRRTRQEETEEDINRDPDSSSDEDSQPLPTTKDNDPGFRHLQQYGGPAEAERESSVFKVPRPVLRSPESTRSNKRGSEEASSGSDDMIFGSSQVSGPSPGKKARSGGAFVNMHVQSGKGCKQASKYGRGGKKPIVPRRSGVQLPSAAKSLNKEPDEQQPKFKLARGGNMFAFGEDDHKPAGFKAAKGAEDASRDGSPSLDELSSADSDIEEIDISTLGLPAPEPYVATDNCEICGTPVPRLLRQEFEDQYTSGKAMSYMWQERFCKYHKVDSAKRTYAERGYPEIDWLRLERRLKRHHKHLEAILTGKTSSYYRDKLQTSVSSGDMKTAFSVLSRKDESKDREVGVGYYGPRGEKLMTDHIVGHFGDELRDLSTNDPLLKASGVAGGVSGFVQAVLVPELAVKLVMEDMKLSPEKARETLVESADVGEFVNDEAAERVKEVDVEELDEDE